MRPENVEVFVRGWTPSPRQSSRRQGRDLGASRWSVVFDCETTTDTAQRLRVGTYQVRHDGLVWEQGFFYDPDALTPTEIRTLRSYAETTGTRLLTRSEFVDEVLLHFGWELSGMIIGFNLRFDVSRIAVSHTKSRSRSETMRGAFSFTLTADATKPVIQVKPAGAKAAFYRFAEPGRRSPEARNREQGGDLITSPGYFVDVATLARALTSEDWRLGQLAEELGTITRKRETEGHGREITSGYLEYALADCQVTWECFEILNARYAAYGLSGTPVYRVFSEASVGKAHFREMDVRGWRTVDPAFPDWLTAVILEGYYGGRTETRIRRTAVPGMLVDFASQYPTSYVLQDLWPYQIASRIDWEEEDAVTVQRLVESVTVDDVLDPELWGELNRMVLVEPNGARLITRATYGRDGTRNIAVARRVGGPPQWYAIADVIAARLEGGPSPRVLRSIRFRPGPPQDRLRPFDVVGSGVVLDPYEDDFVKRLVELRRTVGTRWLEDIDEDAAKLVEHPLKITANSVYGIGIEQNVNEYANPVDITIARTDNTTYQLRTDRKEIPGSYFHPLIATLVAAGGRLLLASVMRLVHDLGGEYPLCDTDGVFIVATRNGGEVRCPGTPTGTVRALSHEQVIEVTERFTCLNPYDGLEGSILEIEHGLDEEVWCWSIASKRYALFTRDPDGRPRLLRAKDETKRSRHGLGHLTGPDGWIDEWWTHLLCVELGYDHPEPEWFDRPAIGKLTIGSHHELRAFKTHNQHHPYPEQVRPFGFLSMAHPDPIDAATDGPRTLVAPYTTNPDQLLTQTWYDRTTGQQWTIRTDRPGDHIEGSALVQSYRDYFDTYRTHPETKAADHTGKQAGLHTRGLLHPRTLRASRINRIGKEANRLTENPDLVLDRDLDYPEPPACGHCGELLTGRQRDWCSNRCRMRAERSAS